jgi:predicted DNA-binding protein YlxM (UPF0122 family)
MKLEYREKISILLETYGNLLTQTQKQALHFYYVEDLSLREIGDLTATTRNAAYDAIKKGEQKLLDIEQKMK